MKLLSLVLILWSGLVSAADSAPTCLAYGKPLDLNNAQILHFKRTTPNQFQERGHVKGTLSVVYPNKNGHQHFEIQMCNDPEQTCSNPDTLEVIYNTEFGPLPDLAPGMSVEACGDYITSTDQSGPYPPSPDGAIIHWVHMNPAGRGHDPGYLFINGTLCGQDAANAGPGRNHGG